MPGNANDVVVEVVEAAGFFMSFAFVFLLRLSSRWLRLQAFFGEGVFGEGVFGEGELLGVALVFFRVAVLPWLLPLQIPCGTP